MTLRRAAYAFFVILTSSLVVLRAQDKTPTGAKIWIGRAAEMEAYLKTAEPDHVENTAVGVTKPQHIFLKPGGPFSEMAFKILPPGMYNGYHESHKAEAAAYELDKVLGMNMVPPTIIRKVNGKEGAAVMWINGTKSFKELGGVPNPPARYQAEWNRELVFAKMFDDLIGNPDPNLGNWLKDDEWNIVLIDHSRSFVPGKDMTHELTRIHKGLWDKMMALNEEELAAGPIGQLLDKKDLHGLFERRAIMARNIDKLVKTKGNAAYLPPDVP
jgi:hypothetical protein